MEAAPNLWGNFMLMSGEDVPLYAAVGGYDALRPVLTTKLGEYNESNAAMELVLFQQVCAELLMICGWVQPGSHSRAAQAQHGAHRGPCICGILVPVEPVRTLAVWL